MTRAACILAVAALAALAACRKTPSGSSSADVSPNATGGDSASSASPSVVGARCHSTDRALSVDDGRGLEDLEIGDAVSYPNGIAIGVVHRAPAGRLAAVALLPADAASLRLVDLGPTLGDAPPPRIAWRGKQLLAAALALPGKPGGRGAATREVALHVVDAAEAAKPLLSVQQQRDDSLGFDLATAGADSLLVWDEAVAGGTPRGVIRAASFVGDQRTGATRDVSPADSDAEAPRVLPSGNGFFVLWIARRPESAGTGEGGPELEATGEARAYGWLEMTTVDAQGAVRGPVTRLTPMTGHVSAYDVQLLAAPEKPTLLIVARDDGEVADGSGGALLRVRAGADGAEPPLAFPSDGLGRGAPTFVDGPSPWLTWVGPHEQLRLLPLDAQGAPTAPPSAEAGLDEARPLLTVPAPGPPSASAGANLLVATPGDRTAQLRVYACSH
jgi:hypothetical protein